MHNRLRLWTSACSKSNQQRSDSTRRGGTDLKLEKARYLRFRYENETFHNDAHEPYYTVVAPGENRLFRLGEHEFKLAQLFDGHRDSDARRSAASQLLGYMPESQSLRLLMHDLAEAGLLEPGADEPLPPPAQLSSALDDRYNVPEQDQGLPSSTQAGSLASPGGEGPLVGAVSGTRGADTGPRVRLPAAPLIWLGHLFNLSLYARLSIVPVVLTIIGLFALWFDRDQAGIDALGLLWLPALIATFAVGAFIINLVSQLARAAAISHYSGEKPVFGIGFAFGFFPKLITATEGPAERAKARARVGIVGAPLHATLWLFVLSALGWFLTKQQTGILSALCLGGAGLSLSSFLFRLNPLVRRDGYFLLAHLLRVPDLRDEAWLSVFNFERPWRDRPAPPKWPLRIYAVAVAAYIIFVVTMIILFPGHWLANFWGGTGVLIFLAFIGLVVWEQSKRLRAGRGRIEGYRFSMPHFSRWVWLLFILLSLLALFPYTYSPSGSFKVVPNDRADVRALVAGVVQSVNTHEGEIVKANDIILVLANSEQKATLASAKAELKGLQAQLALAKMGTTNEKIALAKQEVATARKRLQYSQSEAARLHKAYKQNAVSVQTYEKAEGNAAVQREQLDTAKRNLDVVSAKPRNQSIDSLQAQIEAQQAKVDYAQQELEKTRVRSPIGGQLVSSELMFGLGDYLHEGDLVATVQDTSQLFAQVQMPETTIDEVHLGAHSKAKFWASPLSSFAGHVIRIAPEAERGEHGKVIRVMLAIDETAGSVKPGMTGEAKVQGSVYPAIVVYTRALVRFVMVEVWSWLP